MVCNKSQNPSCKEFELSSAKSEGEPHFATHPYTVYGGRDGIVSPATFYGLGARGSNAGGGEIYRTHSAGPRVHQASYTMGTGSFPGGKVAGA